MLFKLCLECMNYTRKFKRCKLKAELLAINHHEKCNRFIKIPHSIIVRQRRRDKNTKKNKAARKCMKCEFVQEGFCSKYQRFASNARRECIR